MPKFFSNQNHFSAVCSLNRFRATRIGSKKQLLIRYLNNTFVVSVDESASIKELKQAVEDISFIPADQQRLECGGVALTTGTMSGLMCESVNLLLEVNGGMRAKWRKKRMRRLRRKRRKMRQRAR